MPAKRQKTSDEPETLQEAMVYFADKQKALQFFVDIRWPEGVTCPYCEGKEHSFISTRQTWACKSCNKRFSVKVGTLMEDSPIGLDKWIGAIWMITNAKNGVSSHELSRSLGVHPLGAQLHYRGVRIHLCCRSSVSIAVRPIEERSYSHPLVLTSSISEIGGRKAIEARWPLRFPVHGIPFTIDWLRCTTADSPCIASSIRSIPPLHSPLFSFSSLLFLCSRSSLLDPLFTCVLAFDFLRIPDGEMLYERFTIYDFPFMVPVVR